MSLNLILRLLILCFFVAFSCKEKRELENNKKNGNVNSNEIVVKKEINIPHDIKFWLEDEQINMMKYDSSTYWIKYNKIAKIRKDSLSKYNSLSFKEMSEMIKDSMNFWQKNIKIALARETIDRDITDSLQNIIHPVDSILPFGPKPLGNLIKNNKNYLGFYVKKGDSFTEEKKKKRKDIYDTWLYYLSLHPNADADLSEGYIEKLMPKANTYEYLDLGINIDTENQMLDPKNIGFQFRIGNLGKYETYYSTTASDYPYACDDYGKKEEECCYGENFYCESTGYIILYNRKKQHSTIIPAFILQSAGQGYLLNTQFFYIDNNTIHIYKGWFEDGGELAKTHTISIRDNGNIIVNEECVLKDEIYKERYDIEGLDSISLQFKHNGKEFSTKRDSIINNIKHLIPKYPLNLALFKARGTLQVDSKLIDSIFQLDKFYKFSRNQERLHSFYTLPFTTNLNKINLGTFEYWDKGLLQNFQKSWICANIDIDSDDIKDYKLPNLGDYEVYLSIGSDNRKGILTLFNPTTNQANVMNVLEDRNTRFRFFNINRNNQIEIYQGLKNETLNNKEDNIYKVTKTHVIEVSSNNEIKVIPQN